MTTAEHRSGASGARPGSVRERDDGVISIMVALSLVMFLSFLAVVVDLGQIYAARVLISQGTNAAAADAGEILSQGGCAAFDAARAAANDILLDNAPTATLETFTATYGAVVVDDIGDCVAVVADENVGRVDLSAKDERVAIFASFFTSQQGQVSAATGAKWGYVLGLSGRVRPLSLCSANTAYQHYQDYRTALALHEANPLLNPWPDPADPAYLHTFDIEADAFGGSPCDPAYGEFVNIDHTDALGTRAMLAEWVAKGVPYSLELANPADPFPRAWCGDGIGNGLGECEGVAQGVSLHQVAHYLPMLGKPFPIMIHDTPKCKDGQPPVWCDTLRNRRAYPLVSFARVELLCLRITAVAAVGSPTSGTDCAGLTHVAADGNPGDDVMMRLRFVHGQTIQEGNLTADATIDNGLIGLSVCFVDGWDNCG